MQAGTMVIANNNNKDKSQVVGEEEKKNGNGGRTRDETNPKITLYQFHHYQSYCNKTKRSINHQIHTN